MKLFKSTIFSLTALALACAGLTGCQDDIDAPNMEVPVAKSTPNMTLAEFKEMFWEDGNNYCVHAVNPADPQARVIIHGRVISSDEQSNVFKFISIQDETAALTFSIDSYNLYLNYRMGQDIVLDVTDMFVGKYAGLQQMGDSSYYDVQKTPQVTFMSLERFQQRAELNGVPELAKIDTLQVETFADLGHTPEMLRKYQSQLVRLKNVYFEDGGQKKFSEYHVNTNEAQNRNIIDRDGSPLIVRTSGYSTFWNETLPVGNLDITGILTYFNGSWRLVLNDRAGVVAVGDRPGTKEKPYTVDEAVAMEAAGSTDKGWVKGYIVGAVAPEVETVSGNADIEWSAPTVLANTLVIGPTTDTNDWSKCLVVALPADSPFREYGNLRSHPENLGKEIMVQGSFEKYMGTWGITGNAGSASEFEIAGVSISTGEIPAGTGAEDSPYNVAQIVALNPSSTTTAVETDVWVKGYIVGSMPTGGSSTTLSGTNFSTADAATTNLVLGPTPDCTDYTKCVGVQLPTAIRGELALANKPENLGKVLEIKGDVMKYCGGPGIKNGSQYKLAGGGDTPTPPDVPGDGDGSKENPYDVAKIISLNPTSTQDAVETGVWVEGFIVGSMPTGGSSTVISGTNFSTADAATTNLVLGPTADCTDYTKCIGIQLPAALRGELALANKPANLGKKLAIKGDVMKYCGGPGLKNCTEFALDGATTPDVPAADPTGSGTLDDPYNVAKALAVIAAGPADTEVYVKGKISSISEIDTGQYGNATYYISDSGTTANQFYIYRGYWLGGEKFTSADQLAVGAEVIVKGKLINYMGNTPEMEKGNQIVSYNGNTGGDTPNPPTPPDPPTPPTPVEGAVSVLATAMTVPGVTTQDGYSIDIEKAGGASAPTVHAGSASVRVYAKGTIQISGAKMAKIVFTVNDATMKYRYTTLTPSTGAIDPAQVAGDKTVTWVGDATDVTFTVGDLGILGSEPTKPGQFHFTRIDIYPAE